MINTEVVRFSLVQARGSVQLPTVFVCLRSYLSKFYKNIQEAGLVGLHLEGAFFPLGREVPKVKVGLVALCPLEDGEARRFNNLAPGAFSGLAHCKRWVPTSVIGDGHEAQR